MPRLHTYQADFGSPRLSHLVNGYGDAGTVGGGMALGFNLPSVAESAGVVDGASEIDAWIVIRPDDTVVISVARSDMARAYSRRFPCWSQKSLTAIGPRLSRNSSAWQRTST